MQGVEILTIQGEAMHVLITGGTGFIGSALTAELLAADHEVTVLTRQFLEPRGALRYVQDLEEIDDRARIDAVINLAGASLAGRRWSPAYKREILDSRLETPKAVLQLLRRLKSTPGILLNASAIGYYGHHGDERLTEDGATTPGFAQDLCRQWEALAQQASAMGVRVCLLRLGVVLDAGDGAFVQMAQPFRMGIANWMGDGRQWLSWVHRKDVIAAILFLLQQDGLTGPFNLTAPQPITSRDFCAAMKRHTRTLITAPVPGFAMRLLVGEMANELLLQGQRVMPAALEQAGFEFSYPDIDSALDDILGT
jgi:uncharacterized protein (TIGR01777 family)